MIHMGKNRQFSMEHPKRHWLLRRRHSSSRRAWSISRCTWHHRFLFRSYILHIKERVRGGDENEDSGITWWVCRYSQSFCWQLGIGSRLPMVLGCCQRHTRSWPELSNCQWSFPLCLRRYTRGFQGHQLLAHPRNLYRSKAPKGRCSAGTECCCKYP